MPDREKIVKLIEEEISVCESVDQCYRTIDLPALRDILALLKEQEAEIEKLNRFINGFSRDAVPVVRCKDCKYYDHFNGCMSWHDVNSNNDNWYCADGEQRG